MTTEEPPTNTIPEAPKQTPAADTSSPAAPTVSAGSLFGNVTSTFSSWTSSIQKETEKGFPGTFKRFNDLSQTLQAKARELPQNIANLPGSFEAERENFIKNNGAVPKTTNTRGAELVAPWQGYGPYEKEMKQRILALSKDERNFLFSPPEETSFQFDLKAYSQTAKAVLQYDDELARKRFELVPQQVQEPIFWRNYFYRVTLEKQAVLSSTDIDPTQIQEADNDEEAKQQEAKEGKNDVLFDYPSDDGEEDEKKEDKQKKSTSTSMGPEKTTAKSPAAVAKEQISSSSPSKKKEETSNSKTEQNYEDMEDWEREMRKVAGDSL
ncbi:hypothetical protein BDB00DRAFT_833334 [Zychaea mexicana]|uniref:uncharacterized protein n=1 Tax=Zychaea mexicana TaxID=64656 RepID=UPI0022FDDB34|nr:uncharacterized protein BDB00DRAFT_833334 [Zychaea mexicana]KAI9491371.1 hypothetical protein BDB00DRAFT_833334 [Zychaea mexicana]